MATMKLLHGVHAVLDHKFYIESEFQDDLNNIARGFGIAAGSLLLLENALDIAQRRLGGGVATGITMVSTGTDSFKKPVEGALAAQKAIEATNTSLQVTSTAFDIGGFFLIIPSILEARKAYRMNQEVKQIDKKVDEFGVKLEEVKNDLLSDYGKYSDKHTTRPVKELKTYQDYKNFIDTLETDREQLKLNLTNPNNKKRITEIDKMFKKTEQMFDLADLMSPLIETRNDLKSGLTIKIVTSSTNIITTLASTTKAGLAIAQLAGNLNAAGAVAATGLAAFAAPFLVVGGIAQLGFDSYQLDKNIHKKSQFKEVFKELNDAVDRHGNNILKKNEIDLLKDIKYMEMRMINRKMVSTSLGITGDVAAIAVGGVAVASVVVRGGYNGNRSGCSSCSWRECYCGQTYP